MSSRNRFNAVWSNIGRATAFGIVAISVTSACAQQPATAPSITAPAHRPAPGLLDQNGEPAIPFVAIRDVCAWPNLVKMPDGTLVAAIFNQPSHARAIGDVDVYGSTDGGQTWQKRATAVPRDPSFPNNRMNLAFDLLPNGELLLVCSGWTLRETPDDPKGAYMTSDVQRSWVCRSTDGGYTWSIDRESFPEKAPDGLPVIPYGSIRSGADGAIHVAVYSRDPKHVLNGFIFKSADHGKTWDAGTAIDLSRNLSEVFLEHLGGGKWLAAARETRLELYASDDDGKTWRDLKLGAERRSIPASTLQLADGRLLLAHGNRIPGIEGVDLRLSDDGGETWSSAVRGVDFVTYDGGYPSSIQRDDGMVVTAYYARKTTLYDGYQMSVIIWDPAKTFPAK